MTLWLGVVGAVYLWNVAHDKGQFDLVCNEDPNIPSAHFVIDVKKERWGVMPPDKRQVDEVYPLLRSTDSLFLNLTKPGDGHYLQYKLKTGQMTFRTEVTETTNCRRTKFSGLPKRPISPK
jgi:hypothetical protein